jgi:hypothetical protein
VMIREIATGKWIAVSVEPVEAADVRNLGTGWEFDWLTEIGRAEVFKLIDPAAPKAIYGLIALARRQDHVEVTLLESSPENVGADKRFERIPGCLLSYAVRLSLSLQFEGCLALESKTDLIDHYENKYGFSRLGHSSRMLLMPGAAARLLAEYEKRVVHG